MNEHVAHQSEVAVKVPGGRLSVLDHGGSGRDVLLVHSVGQTGAVWDQVVPHLVPHARVVSLDLRGHGRSTAEFSSMAEATDTLRVDLADVITGLALDSPVVVGYDIGARLAVELALASPELVGAAVAVDCSLTEPAEVLERFVAEMDDGEMQHNLAERFAFGAAGTGPVEQELFTVVRAFESLPDWMEAAGNLEAAVRRARRSVREHPDGTWTRRPRAEATQLFALANGPGPRGQGREMLAQVRIPTRLVVVSEGRFGRLDTELLDLVDGSPCLDLALIDGDGQVLDHRSHEVAGQIRLAAASADNPVKCVTQRIPADA